MTFQMIVSAGIFVFVYGTIIADKFDRTLVALSGGVLMVVCGVLEQEEAFHVIDYNTLSLLMGMMIIVSVIKRTGLFEYLSIKMIKSAGGEPWKILVYLTIITAVISAFLDNVTTILLILPILFWVTHEMSMEPTPFVLSLVFASNIGGTATLIGDPPNIMIGSKANLTFNDFIKNVAPVIVPILVVSIICFLLIFKKHLRVSQEDKRKILLLDESKLIGNRKLMVKSIIVLGLTILGFLLQGIFAYESSTVAICGAVLLLLISDMPFEKMVNEIEWKTIFFITGLFMVVGGIEKTGLLKLIAGHLVNISSGNLVFIGISILWGSAIISAFIDNIPFTATMIPIIKEIGNVSGMSITPLWWALSLGACLGGNGTIIGASANVIASGMMEKNGHRISFNRYFKICFPLMVITIVISSVYLLVFFLL